MSSVQSFLSAVFDTLLYQLNDALSRLINVRKYEAAKDGEWNSSKQKIALWVWALVSAELFFTLIPNLPLLLSNPSPSPFLPAGQWSSLSAQQRREKEAFLANEQRASKGFMTQVSAAYVALFLLAQMARVR